MDFFSSKFPFEREPSNTLEPDLYIQRRAFRCFRWTALNPDDAHTYCNILHF